MNSGIPSKIDANNMPNDTNSFEFSVIAHFFFCSNALIALARSLCKCLLAGVFCHRTQLRLCATQRWAFLFPRKHLDAATIKHQDSTWHGGHIPRRVAGINNASRSYAWRSFRRRHDLHAVKARQ